jgi:hypothetical protein
MNVIDELEGELGPVSSMPKSGVSGIEGRIGAELEAWNGRKENSPAVRSRLEEYWSTIDYPGWTPTGTPWSAAFVSYALRPAGFPQKAAHYQYTEEIAAGKVPGWQAYSIPKNTDSLQLSPGDVLVRGRGEASSREEAQYYYTHGDVVWKIEDNIAYLVGGNLSDSAKVIAQIPVTSSGKPLAPIQRYRVILKKKSSHHWLIGLGLLGAGAWWFTRGRAR